MAAEYPVYLGGPVMSDDNPYEGEEPSSSENAIQTQREQGLEGPTMVSTEAPDSDEGEGGDDDVPQLTRKQKKQQRFSNAHARADASDAKFAASEQRNLMMERRIQDMEAREARRVQENPGKDPLQERLDNNKERTQGSADLYNAKVAAGTQTEKDYTDFVERSAGLEEERFDIRYDMKRGREPASPQLNPQAMARQMRYPEIYKDAPMREMAHAKGQLWYRNNPNQEIPEDVMDGIADDVMKEFGKGGYSRGLAPTPDQRRNHAGPPRGRSAAQRQAPEKRIEMTRERKEMAETLYDTLEPQEAHAKWAQGPGKRMMQRQWEDSGR